MVSQKDILRKRAEALRAVPASLCGVFAVVAALVLTNPQENFHWGWPYWTLLACGGIIGGYGRWRDWLLAPIAVGFGQIAALLSYCLFAGEMNSPFLLPMLLAVSFLALLVSGPCAIIGILAFGVMHPELSRNTK